MARTKKTEEALSAYNDERLVSKFDKKVLNPVVTRGSHLTVTTHPDGRTVLAWDDAALLRDVQQAIAEWEQSQLKPPRKAAARKKPAAK